MVNVNWIAHGYTLYVKTFWAVFAEGKIIAINFSEGIIKEETFIWANRNVRHVNNQ